MLPWGTKKGWLSRATCTALLTSAALLIHAPGASASSFYYEFQGGLGQIRNADPFFGAGAPSPSAYGTSFNLALAYSFSGGEIPAELQIGLHSRFVTAGADNGMTYYTLITPYPIVRLQLSRIFITAGATPFFWKRVGSTAGLDSLETASGSIAFLGEAGFLWPVAPIFSLGAALGAQYITTSGTYSPKPVIEATVVFRFYFGFSKGGTSAASSNEFKGWRYPFGNDMRD